MTNITQFPKQEPLDPLVGPFEYHKVIVEGRAIPYLSGYYDGDGICLVVDHRFGVTVPKELAHQVAWLLGNAMAVASGYPWLGAETKDMPFAPRCTELGEAP